MPKLSDCLKESTNGTLSHQFPDLLFEWQDIEMERLPYYQHMCAMITSSQQLSVLFKLFYTELDALALAEVKSPGYFTEALVSEFIKDQVNMMVGRLKEIILSCEVPLGYSIPVILPGYTEAFFSYRSKAKPVILQNLVTSPKGHFAVQGRFTFHDPGALLRIEEAPMPSDSKGQISFL